MASLGPWLFILRLDAPGKPKVADGDLTVRVYQNVCRLQVPVRYVSGVKVLDGT